MHVAGGFGDLEPKLLALAHGVLYAPGWRDVQHAAHALLGGGSFTAGVVIGLDGALLDAIVSMVDLVRMLALAEYWESRHSASTWGRLRANLSLVAMPGLGMAFAGMTGFSSYRIEQRAREAYDQRQALVEAIKAIFAAPQEFIGKLTADQVQRVEQLTAAMHRRTLADNFEAGQLFGQLLFDALLMLDLAAGLAKLVTKVPALASYARDLARLAEDVRMAKRLRQKAAEEKFAEPLRRTDGMDTSPGRANPARSARKTVVARDGAPEATEEMLGGAGGNWRIANEVSNSSVVQQATPTSCGAACGQMLLADRSIVVTQEQLGFELLSAQGLAGKMNSVSPGWMGAGVDTSSFNALNRTGSWSAMMFDGGSVGHWVVVDGVDEAGMVMIRDPWNATSYTMTQSDFMSETSGWTGFSVFKLN